VLLPLPLPLPLPLTSLLVHPGLVTPSLNLAQLQNLKRQYGSDGEGYGRRGSSPSIWRESINQQKMFPPLQSQPFKTAYLLWCFTEHLFFTSFFGAYNHHEVIIRF
jgi:hypothetical protein